MSNFGSSFAKCDLTAEQVQLLEIQDHMRRLINDFALVFAQTCHGFSLLRTHLESERQSLLAQLAEMLPSDDPQRHYDYVSQLLVPYQAGGELSLAIANGTLQSFHSDAAPDSHHLQVLASSLLIALYQHWEHTWRPGIQAVTGQKVLSDFWGEVCKLRDCILHNKARANADYERRAKVLKWFSDGEAIQITAAQFTAFISEARAYCESFIAQSHKAQ